MRKIWYVRERQTAISWKTTVTGAYQEHCVFKIFKYVIEIWAHDGGSKLILACFLEYVK